MQIGVCYYPEHWDRSLWEKDAGLMRETGISVARLAEFAWCRLEPEEGRYDFAWLDEAIGILHRHGIRIVLGTPTCCPPNWLVEKYPDVLPTDAGGSRINPGVRGHRCYNSPSMRRYSAAVVRAMADHFARNPAVIGWQIDNEFMLLRCTCGHCESAFRAWLRTRYGSLEAINRAWGTVVWGGEYGDWSQVHPPWGGSPFLNPSYLLAWHRFENDSIVAFQRMQADILRERCHGHFITHNSWAVPLPLDYTGLFRELDFASVDYYPATDPAESPTTPYAGAMMLDLTRGFKRRGFWVMEQLSGTPGGWMHSWRAPYPGLIRAFGWQSFARGAETVVFFRWRSGTVGAEQFWHGILDHANVPNRRLAEVARLCGEVNRLAPWLDGTVVGNGTAILYSFEQHTAYGLQKQAEGMDYYENLKLLHRALAKLGVGTDVIDWREDLAAYRLVVAPSLFLLDGETAAPLARFAENGGTLVITNRTGVKNLDNACRMAPLPGPLARCAGVEVEEYDPIGKTGHRIETRDRRAYECRQWCDILRPTTAEVRATYVGDFYAGRPAVTANRFGKGTVYYVGTNPEESFWRDLFGEAAALAGITGFPCLPEGVQASLRSGPDRSYLFLCNLSRETKTVPLEGEYESILTGRRVGPALDIPALDVEILKKV